MFCGQCGEKLSDTAKFCHKCGKPTIIKENDRKKEIIDRKTLIIGSSENMLDVENKKYEEKAIVTQNRLERDSISSAGKIFLIVIVIGIIVALVGFCGTSKLSDSYEGNSISIGYKDSNGNFHTTQTGTIGGNSEAVEFYDGLAIVFIAFVLIFIIYLFVFWMRKYSYDNMPVIRKKGIIIEKSEQVICSITIDFEDGTREKLNYDIAKFIFVIGDCGHFEYKKKQLIAYEKC